MTSVSGLGEVTELGALALGDLHCRWTGRDWKSFNYDVGTLDRKGFPPDRNRAGGSSRLELGQTELRGRNFVLNRTYCAKADPNSPKGDAQ